MKRNRRKAVRSTAVAVTAAAALTAGMGTATAAPHTATVQAQNVQCVGTSRITVTGAVIHRPTGWGWTHCPISVYKIKVRTWMKVKEDPNSPNIYTYDYDMSVAYNSYDSGAVTVGGSDVYGHGCFFDDIYKVVSKHTYYVRQGSPKRVMWSDSGWLGCQP